MQQKICSECSTDMTCGSGLGQCWCMAYKAVIVVDAGKDCLCEACLKKAIADQVVALTEQAEEESDYYIENGLYVFTSRYHLKRGWCCKNGCRHCPY